jgi:putative transposase
VWRTRGSARLLDARLARFLCRFFRAVARQERVRVLEVGLVADHVHLLLRLHPEARISRLVQRLKGGSALLARKENHAAAGLDLRWSKGYTIESVSPRGLVAARGYVRGQPERHPDRAIAGWEGDVPEYDRTGLDEWRGEGRRAV